MERESFVFYKSFGEVAKTLSDDERLKFYDTIIGYGLWWQNEEIWWIIGQLFTLIRPQLDANNKKHVEGKKWGEYWHLGGRPRKPQGVISENPPETPNVNVNANENVNENVEGFDFLKLAPEGFKEFRENYPKKIKLPLTINSFRHALNKTTLKIILEWVKIYRKKSKWTEERYLVAPNDRLDQERWLDHQPSSPTPPPKQEQPEVVKMTEEQRQASLRILSEKRSALASKMW